MRTAAAVELNSEQRQARQRMARARSMPARCVERARIVLLAADGLENQQIAQRMRMTPEKAARWRNRFLAGGIAALEKDAPRPGRTRIINERKVKTVVEMTRHDKPAHATHWSTRTMSRAAGISEASVRPWIEAASGADFQAQPRSPVPGEAGGHRRPVSESARARHRGFYKRGCQERTLRLIRRGKIFF